MEDTAFDHANEVIAVIASLWTPPVTVKVSVTVTAEAFADGQPPETSQTTRSVETMAGPTMTEVLVLQ